MTRSKTTGPLTRSATRLARGLATASLVVAFALGTGYADAQQRGVGALDQLILDARSAKVAPEKLATSLAARDTKAASGLFSVLAADAIQVRVGERGRVAEPLSRDERAAILQGLTGFSPTGLRGLLRARLAGGPGEGEQIAALEVLALTAGAKDLEAFLDWAQAGAKEERVSRGVRAAFAAELEVLLERSPELAGDMPQLYRRAHHSLLPGFLSALGSTPGPGRLAALSEFLGAVRRFDAHVLAEIGAMTREARFVAGDMVAVRTRPYIASPDRVLSIEAMAVAQHVVDVEAVPALIAQLEHPDRALRRAALKALTSMSGEQLDPSPETWKTWHQRIRSTWRNEAPKYMELARSGAPGLASRAIQELSLLKLYRHELVGPLSRALARDEVELVVLATAALGHLGSVDAVPHLIAQLDKENLDVRRAAYHALRRVTGENHGDDPSAWRKADWGVDLSWPLAGE